MDGARGLRPLGRRRYLHFLQEQLLAARGFGEPHAAVTAAIDTKAFQIEPALAMLRHARLRIFIADGVGLGKTVQAGLIVNELAASTDAFRALVVVPAGLRQQWQEEVAAKFSLEATIADTRWLLARTRDLPADVNPWSLPGLYLSSYDFLKQPEVLRAVEDVRWDVLVADEVHAASPGTARLAAVQVIGARARRIVLLSATPPDGDPAALRALADIGRFSGEPPMTIFRRSRQDAGYTAARRTVLLAVRLTGAERLMHARLDMYAGRVWRESASRQDPAARLAAMVLKKRALSTARSLSLSVRRRIVLLSGTPTSGDQQLRLPLFDEDPLPDDVEDDLLAAPGLADAESERVLLSQIAEAAEGAVSAESKVRALGRLLRRVHEPVIVFTEYRDTVAQLACAFASRQPLTLDGSMTPSERAAVQRTFAASGSLLLSTDAASEGLNLHHRCRLVVHFELPWTPMRLEQRAGRVDRIGQVRKVHEVMLVARHTSERYVLGPLVRRIRTTTNAGVHTGLTSLAESTVAGSVLGDTHLDPPAPLSASPFEALSLKGEAEAECERLASLRRLARGRERLPLTPPPETAICVGRWRTGELTVVIRATLESNGTVIDDRLLPILLTCRFRVWPNSVPLLRTLATQLARHLVPRLHEHPNALETVREAERSARHALSELAVRESRLANSYSGRRASVQPGLFDRRAVRNAEAHDRAATLLMEETRSRIVELTEVDLRREFEIVAIHPGRWIA